MKWLSIFALLCASVQMLDATGQVPKPHLKAGDVMFDYTFTDLLNYPTKRAKISDFKGKWLVLDLWGRTCSGCLSSFPKMNAIAAKLKDSLQLIMVGGIAGETREKLLEEERLTKRIYTRLAKQHGLTFTTAFDSVFYKLVNPATYPHILLIDPSGRISAIAADISDKQLSAIMHGRQTEIIRSYAVNEQTKNYDSHLPLLTNGKKANGGVDTSYLYRSLITRQSEEMPNGRIINLNGGGNVNVRSGKLEVLSTSKSELYRLAYFGETAWQYDDPKYYGVINWTVMFETSDSTFKEDYHKYAYSLKIPAEKATVEYVKHVLKKELDIFFGCESGIEYLETPVVLLRNKTQNALRRMVSKGGPSRIYHDQKRKRLCFSNVTLDEVGKYIGGLLTSPDYKPILNGTTYSGKVDFELALPDNYVTKEALRSGLQRRGIILTKAVKRMQNIVLRDDPALKSTATR